MQPQCFENCIGKIRLQGFISTPKVAREDNPIDYLVHILKVALPLYPQFGLEPNVYYIPPIHVPFSFLEMMFGPSAKEAVERYQAERKDEDGRLRGLLALFGCTPRTVERFKIAGGEAIAMNEKGEELVRVPVKEPVFIRPGFDPASGVARLNTP
jgi:nitrate reductase beta subunit